MDDRLFEHVDHKLDEILERLRDIDVRLENHEVRLHQVEAALGDEARAKAERTAEAGKNRRTWTNILGGAAAGAIGWLLLRLLSRIHLWVKGG